MIRFTMPASYVFGNAPALLELTNHERKCLDASPQVAVLNDFPPHWRIAGFRPTMWVVGDCFNMQCRMLFRERMEAASKDSALFERLHTLFLCPETLDGNEADMQELLASIASFMPTVTVRLYRRGNWEAKHQTVATNFNQTMVHAGSTLTDAINLMAIQNPGEPVRIAGCPYQGRHGYFYETSAYENTEEAIFLSAKSRLLMWESFADMRAQGIDLIDCNSVHGAEIPPELRLPRDTLFPKEGLFARFFH